MKSPRTWLFARQGRWLLAGLVVLARGAGPASAAAPDPVPADRYVWRNVIIKGGGFVTGLLYHPAERDLLYARTDVGGVYRWEAAARSWVPLTDDFGRDSAEVLGVVSFAIDPGEASRLYLAAGSYLQDWGKPAAFLWSEDRGSNWHRLPLPFRLGGNADGRSAGERLQVDPHDGRILLLGTNHDGLWRSDDRGLKWERVASFPRSGLTFVLFSQDDRAPSAPTNLIYAGAADSGEPALYWSNNAGVSWSAVPGQPTGCLIQHAGVDANGTLYLTCANALGPNGITDGAVWKYVPATATWSNITPVAPRPGEDAFGYAGLALDARHPGTLLVSTLDRWSQHDEIFRSTDGGARWIRLLASARWDHAPAPYTRGLTPHWIGQLALNPADAEQAWFITGYGLWLTDHVRAADAGAATAWTFATDGLEETVVDDLVSPPEGAPLVSAISDYAGFRHDNLQASPAAGPHQPMHGGSPSIAFAAQIPAKMVRTHWGPTRGALSPDGGRTWRDFPAAPPTAVRGGPGRIAISADGRRLVWLPKGSAPYFSPDDGATWSISRGGPVIPNDHRVVSPMADRVNTAKFYINDQTTGRIYVSTDGGESFRSPRQLTAGGGTLVAEPDREGHLWLPLPDGLYHSDDSGESFERLPSVQEAYQIGLGCAAPGRTGPALYLAGRVADHDAIFRSDDAGRTWVMINDPRHRFGWLRVVTGDPRVYGRVYLGTSGRGIIYGERAAP